jgi:hypothetical protein
MKKILVHYISLVALCLSMVSCKDFLDEQPQTSRSADNAYKTAADFNNAVIGAYATLKLPGLYANGGITSSLLMMSDGIADSWDIGQTRNNLTTFQYEIEEFNISLSNTLVTNAWRDHYIGIGRTNTILDKISAIPMAADLKARYDGEARFLRAYFYFNLVRLFGDVQLVDRMIDGPSGANTLVRSPEEEVYRLIINDLSIAEENLPDVIPAAEAGRASKWAAKALLGKVYLTRKEYGLAAAKLNEVINSGKFNVTSNSYAAVFSPATSFTANKDVIFAVQYKSGLVNQGSALWSSMVPFGAPGNLFGVTATGEGYMRPTLDLANAYEEGDLRKAASMLSSYKAANGSTIQERYTIKYRQDGQASGDADTDLPLLRYADVLLMYAEALNAQGQTSAAEPFLNQVRARAGLTEKTGLNQADFALAIEQERRVELAFEGHRWFDLVRTGRYLEVMTSKGYPAKAFHRFYPIPQRETDLNSLLTQNAGY